MEVQENRLYVLPQLKKRAIIPKLFSLITLSTIFYLGVWLNLALLEVTEKQEKWIKLLSLILVGILVTIGVIITISTSRKKYVFYRDRIIFGRKLIYYTQMVNTNPARNFKDKLFKTYSVKLNDEFTIKYIPSTINLVDYLQNLRAYSSQSYR